MDKLVSRLIGATAVTLISLMLSSLLSVVTSAFIARSVGPAPFGMFSLILALQAATLVVSTLGMDLALTKFIAGSFVKDRDVAASYVRQGLTIAAGATAASCGVLIFLRDPIGSGLFNSDDFASLMLIAALLIFSTSILSIAYGILRGYQQIALLSISRVLCSILTLLAVIPLTMLYGLEGAIVGFVLGQSVAAIAIFIKVDSDYHVFTASPQTNEVDKRYRYRELIDFGAPAVLTGLLTGPAYLVGQSTLAMTSGFQVLALFAVSMYFFQLFSTIARSISIPLVPKVAELWHRSREMTVGLLSQSAHATLLVMFPLAMTLGLCSHEAVYLLYGDEFTGATDAVYLMIVASFFAAIASIVNSFLTGTGKIWLAFGVRGLWAAAFLVLIVVLVPRFDVMGLALSFVASYALLVVVSIPMSRWALSASLGGSTALLALCGLLFCAVYPLVSDYDIGFVARLALAVAISTPFAYSAWVRYLREGFRSLLR